MPAKSTDSDDIAVIEHNEEYDQFIRALEEYHNQRHTYFTPEPELNKIKINLLNLYKKVMQEGGYDVISETKGGWRDFVTANNLQGTNANTSGYLLKTIYYKNLAAYEIKFHWNKDPPSKELLEDRTAAGGAIMTRTEAELRAKIEPEPRMAIASSPPGISTRSLRQQPVQRKFFQPDTAPGRSTRNSSAGLSPGPRQSGMNGSRADSPSLGDNLSGSFGPSAKNINGPVPFPVITPATNPSAVRQSGPPQFTSNAISTAANLVTGGIIVQNQPQDAKITIPKIGAGALGSDVMTRVVLCLRSGIHSEEVWATRALIRMSFEAADNLQFKAFQALPIALLETISRSPFITNPEYLLPDATTDLKLRQEKLNVFTEAVLTIRNCTLNPDNAAFLANIPMTRKLLLTVYSFPDTEELREATHYCYDIMEAVSFYMNLKGPTDEILFVVRDSISFNSRTLLMSGLRSLSRMVIRDHSNVIRKVVGPAFINQVCRILLLDDDEELLAACLDFLFQYFHYSSNVDEMLEVPDAIELVRVVSRLLFFHSNDQVKVLYPPRAARVKQFSGVVEPAAPSEEPDFSFEMPQDLTDALAEMKEPERATRWLQSCYEVASGFDIPQINLWKAYEKQFEPLTKEDPETRLLPAADFIRNITQAFEGQATAMVIPGPGNVQRFIIRGIRPRLSPLSAEGTPYIKCRWPGCGNLFEGGKGLANHVGEVHFKDEGCRVCKWDSKCTRFTEDNPAPDRVTLLLHLRTHLGEIKKSTREGPFEFPLVMKTRVTAVDEQGEAAGVPLSAVLVLRNIARTSKGKEAVRTARDTLYEVVALNYALAEYALEVLNLAESDM
ncbi:hypothetical protein CANCADRAFT_45105 [Tortispora caseinolytica NRRL Y-17796]|uniref:ARID domain-containing protein n=1 Tax=Tortispora caseinolytica NRRL Y-17796 TaxID=767744 RepID=A0A1E4TA58_9ASCO|nr:hypothetical protein CANCADRAFT_45105 [Tortispora caseinolytica NRRL Y-17796]